MEDWKQPLYKQVERLSVQETGKGGVKTSSEGINNMSRTNTLMDYNALDSFQ